MTFYYGNDISNIIKKYSVDEFNYNIEYLDGSVCNYYCTNKDYKNNIEQKMLKQIIKRDLKCYEFLEKKIKINLTIIRLLLTSTLLASYSKLTFIICLNIIFLIISTSRYKKHKKELEELKKYRVFLSMYEELQKEENKNITDILNYDKLYQIPYLDINTIDDFNLKDIIKINEEVEKRKLLKAK